MGGVRRSDVDATRRPAARTRPDRRRGRPGGRPAGDPAPFPRRDPGRRDPDPGTHPSLRRRRARRFAARVGDDRIDPCPAARDPAATAGRRTGPGRRSQRRRRCPDPGPAGAGGGTRRGHPHRTARPGGPRGGHGLHDGRRESHRRDLRVEHRDRCRGRGRHGWTAASSPTIRADRGRDRRVRRIRGCLAGGPPRGCDGRGRPDRTGKRSADPRGRRPRLGHLPAPPRRSGSDRGRRVPAVHGRNGRTHRVGRTTHRSPCRTGSRAGAQLACREPRDLPCGAGRHAAARPARLRAPVRRGAGHQPRGRPPRPPGDGRRHPGPRWRSSRLGRSARHRRLDRRAPRLAAPHHDHRIGARRGRCPAGVDPPRTTGSPRRRSGGGSFALAGAAGSPQSRPVDLEAIAGRHIEGRAGCTAARDPPRWRPAAFDAAWPRPRCVPRHLHPGHRDRDRATTGRGGQRDRPRRRAGRRDPRGRRARWPVTRRRWPRSGAAPRRAR